MSSETSVTVYQPTFRDIVGDLIFSIFTTVRPRDLDHMVITFICSEPRLDNREIKQMLQANRRVQLLFYHYNSTKKYTVKILRVVTSDLKVNCASVV